MHDTYHMHICTLCIHSYKHCDSISNIRLLTKTYVTRLNDRMYIIIIIMLKIEKVTNYNLDPG